MGLNGGNGGPPAPPELAAYLGRVLPVRELEEGLGVAAALGIAVTQKPVQGGWMLERAP